jgi:hypothetical protein
MHRASREMIMTASPSASLPPQIDPTHTMRRSSETILIGVQRGMHPDAPDVPHECPICSAPTEPSRGHQRLCRRCSEAELGIGPPYSLDADRRAARVTLARALRRGQITKPITCEMCGTQPEPRDLVAHHAWGYSGANALRVMWICRREHGQIHRPVRSTNYKTHRRKGST